jgi:hypothetical protein
MKHLIALTLTLTCALSSFAQINLCPKNDVDWTTRLQALPDSDLPIINVKRIMTQEYVKSIKTPERVMGMLSSDEKHYLGFSDNSIYKINIETEAIESFPFKKEGTLPSGEPFEWEFQLTQVGVMYLYKYSKKTELPLNIYKVNFGTKTIDLVWETGLTMAKDKELRKIPLIDYWTYADQQGNAVILHMGTKTKAMEHKFNVPSELVNREGAILSIDMKASYQGGTKYQCSHILYSVSDYQIKKSYIAKYDVNTKQTLVSQLVDGSPTEWLSNGRSYWAVFKFHDESTDLTVYNDRNFSDVRFQFTGLKKGGGPFKLDYNDTWALQKLSVTYASGTVETYDWATKKLLKTEKAKVEITDF